MPANTAPVKTKTGKPFISEGPKPDRPMTEGIETAKDFAQQGAAYSKDIYEKTKTATEETNKVLGQTYSAATKGAMDFNLQWIEMARVNANSAFDFARQLIAAKSPSEFLELAAAHGRKQLETFTEQAQQLTSLAQKVTTNAVQPVHAGVKSAFDKVA